MLTTGLRIGEALALRWVDVDLKAGQLRVVHTVQRVDGEWQLLEPKTESSRRTVRLSAITVAALRAQRAKQGIVTLDGFGVIVPSRTRTPIAAASVRNAFRRLLRRACLPALRVHDRRHSYATIQFADGHPRQGRPGATGP